MILRAKMQRHIVLFYREGDSGDWFACACRAGVAAALGRKLSAGETIRIECRLTELQEPDHADQ